MDRGIIHAGTPLATIGAMVAACLLTGPASAGDNVQVVPLFADGRGNQAWVEIVTVGERRQATPVVWVGDGRVLRLLENPHDNGRLAVPVPRLMRFVERARKAIRAMKRPGGNAPAGPEALAAAAPEAGAPVSEPRESPPDRTGSSSPPGKTGTGDPPSDDACKTATR